MHSAWSVCKIWWQMNQWARRSWKICKSNLRTYNFATATTFYTWNHTIPPRARSTSFRRWAWNIWPIPPSGQAFCCLRSTTFLLCHLYKDWRQRSLYRIYDIIVIAAPWALSRVGTTWQLQRPSLLLSNLPSKMRRTNSDAASTFWKFALYTWHQQYAILCHVFSLWIYLGIARLV